MKTYAQQTFASLFASLVCATGLALGVTFGAHASPTEDAKDLFENTEELSGFIDQVGSLNPLAGGGLGGDIKVFGVESGAYLYSPTPLSKPVLALLLPSISLGSIVPLLKDTPMDVTLDTPTVFVTSADGDLKIEQMPDAVKNRSEEAGLASSFKVDNGFNIFGKVGGHGDALHQVLSLVNLKGALLAGYSSASKKVLVKPDDAKKTKFKYRVLSLALPTNASWENPLFMENVSISGAAIRMKTPKDIKVDGTTTFQLIGGARVGATTGYHVFIERTFDKKDPSKSLPTLLAINPDHAVTMGDFLAVSRAMGHTLGLPVDALPKQVNLPLDQIRLRNPFGAKLAFPDEGAPPDFSKVMFAGASPNAKIPDHLLPGPLLTANATADVFGFEASSLKLNFDLTGITATAGIKLPKLGPVSLANANLDLAIRPSALHMQINANSELGALTVSASSSGLSFVIPPKCPLEPLGLKATLNGFDLTKDFSIKPDMKDCVSAEIKALVNDIGGKATQTIAEVAGDVAGPAEDLARGAGAEFRKLDAKRIETWAKAVDARIGPTKAKEAAQKAYDDLGVKIHELNGVIHSLSDWIEDALRSVWDAIKGELKSKKKERSQKIAERDRAWAERSAAAQRIQQAADAEKQAVNAPVPSQYPDLRSLQEQQLSQMAIAAQQSRIAAAAKNIPLELASAEARKTLLDEYDVASHAAIAETEWTQKNGTSLGDYLGKTRQKILPVKPLPVGIAPHHDSPGLPSGEAILTSIIDKKLAAVMTKILANEVSNVPTMAYGTRVLMQGIQGGALTCLTVEKNQSGGRYFHLSTCDGRPEQRFSFDPSGLVRLPDITVPMQGKDKKNVDVRSPCLQYSAGHLALNSCDAATTSNDVVDWSFMFFFDPLDGLIRQPRKVNVAGYSKDACLYRFSDGGIGTGGTCTKGNNAPKDQPSLTPMTWRLVGIGLDGQSVARAATAQLSEPRPRAAAGSGSASVSAIPVISEGLTNIAPLHLEPLPP